VTTPRRRRHAGWQWIDWQWIGWGWLCALAGLVLAAVALLSATHATGRAPAWVLPAAVLALALAWVWV
jgi:hypothetical protein